MNRRHVLSAALGVAVALPLAGCGKVVPEANAATAAPAGRWPAPREAYELAATGHGFSVGPMMASNTVYVFFDTTCPHCAQLWQDAKPLLTKLKMVWMPVGLLRQQSASQGATILAAASPAEAMSQNEASVLDRKGGITASPVVNEAAMNKVKVNSELLGRLGAESVPYILYKNAKTGEYGARAGTVSTFELAALVGV